MEKRFAGKVVIVTGASSGIGKAAAIEFGREGARVVVAARRAEQCKAVVDEIKTAGGEAVFVPTDVGDSNSIQQMVARTIEIYGRLDCAFNNAGISGDGFRPTAAHTEKNWDAVMNVNVKGVWLSMKYQIPAMLEAGGGAIVNNSSILGLRATTIGNAPYCASKHAVIGLTKTAAVEYAAQNIRVNAVCPGWTSSEMVDPVYEHFPEQMAQMINQVPMKRHADAAEIARAVVWLCSDDASYVTGQAFAPDGGLTA